MSTIFNVRKFGATGDGYANDGPAIRAAFQQAIDYHGEVFFPPGSYLITEDICFLNLKSRISINGCGQNTTMIYAQACGGIQLGFQQNGLQQPWGVSIRNIGLHALGQCKEAIHVSYGAPPQTSDHNQPSVSISNVQVVSDGEGSWCNGIQIVGAWNPCLENVFISGNSYGGDWSKLSGAGVSLIGSCVNAHLVNVRCNFWADGIWAEGVSQNTEGIFCSNCSMVAVKRGVRIKGVVLAGGTARMSTLTWTGGMIECRVGGITDGSAAFHLERVWTALVTGCQMLTETLDTGEHNTYAVSAVDCHGVVVTGCDINAWRFGLATSGDCRAISTHGNTFTNCAIQTVFNAGTSYSRSYGHVLVNNAVDERDFGFENKIGFVN